jgi:SAM-dependent methyltransferase
VRLLSRVEAVLRNIQGPDVLDIGCSGQAEFRSSFESPDWLHGRLKEAFPDVWGLEYDPDNVQALHEAGYTNVVQGDAQSFVLDRRFDTIVAGELIEHVERPGDLLSRAAEHLKPGGRVVITTPYAFSFLFVVYAWLRYPKTCSNPEHVTWFCPATLTELARRADLVVDRFELVEDYRADLPSPWYRAFLRVYRLVRRLIPMRMRANHMLFVLAPNAD